MADAAVSLEKWRGYFRSASSDIFNIIEHAILVAASDCPYDFRLKRDRIAEMLFTCKAIKCFGCDKVELAVPNGDGLGNSEDKLKSEIDAGGSKESKVNSSSRDYDVDHVVNYSDGDAEAEALTDDIEEESHFYGEVLRIKDVVDNFEEESDALLFDCLRKLQLMPFSEEILKATEIGKSVNALRKHESKEIRNLARTLIEDWKVMVDSWVNATAAVAEMAIESVKTSAVEEEEEEEEGLPSPPLDEGAFFATPSSMELSQFFDGMDDDGNPRCSGGFNKNRGSGRKPAIPKIDSRNWRCLNPHDSRAPPNDRKPEPKREEATWMKQGHLKPHRPSSDASGPGRPKPSSIESGRFKPSLKPKVEYETIKVQQKSENHPIQRKLMPPHQEKANSKDEASVRMKLEAAKRKLQERYQEAENAKKQRTIQVVELQDLPKQSQQRNPHMRPGNHNRQWANGRR
ncbi:probable mediator of RNA polymerase II transcription subunit 26b isoform X1 [Salvia splendens]|uniref:probable mediator of RNA polymerase II transcription subunit 26b isoform X1 n=1 Tax=Salvia splendens TaxID=180675 RepID=UPI001C260F77|nr:probable mediator of RNA polymerase II transcription subunit 26b isoform X1 [Salvia splendens]